LDLVTTLVLSLALAADAVAVAATRGLAVPRLRWRHFASVALWFGTAQGGMTLLGGLLGGRFGPALAAYDHWIAFGLLSALGLKLLYEAWSAEDEPSGAPDERAFATRTMALLALATSIDALAAGVTLPLIDAPLALTCTSIGVVTALTSALGLYAGRRFGALLGKRVDVAGGLVLIGLGTKILLEHLSA
jgi:putative Mn2+ efflux pump MntP